MASNSQQQQIETLIPCIKFMRKWQACNKDQRVEFLSKLPQIFHEHNALEAYSEIVFKELLRPLGDSSSLSQDIQSRFPSDSELGLRDTVYESKLVDTSEDEDKESTNQKKDKLPITLLRIPSDLQYHLFHFLNLKSLVRVQSACRALCIAARNPASLHSLKINPKTSRNWPPLFQESLSRPNTLSITNWSKIPLIANPKWGQNVTELDLTFSSEIDAGGALQMVPFQNLKKCELFHFHRRESSNYVNVLGNLITSYSTLEELNITTCGLKMTADTIDALSRFQNLRTLSLNLDADSEGQQYDPILLPKLERLSFIIRSTGAVKLFLRILIGSHPQKVDIESCSPINLSSMSAPTGVPAICNVESLTITERHGYDSSQYLKILNPLFEKARLQFRDQPVLKMAEFNLYFMKYRAGFLNDIVTMFQFAEHTTLRLKEYFIDGSSQGEMDKMMKGICNAPYGTFTEIAVEVDSSLMAVEDDSGKPYIMDAIDSVDDEKCIEMFIIKCCDEMEKWFESLRMMMNEQRMKAIGLRKYDIKLEGFSDWEKCAWEDCCDREAFLDKDQDVDAIFDHFETKLKKEGPKCLAKRLELWGRNHTNISSKISDDGSWFTVAVNKQL